MLDALGWGVIATVVFLASTIILTIPVFATRGRAQVTWFAIIGFLLTVELAALVAVGILIDKGKIFN
jgi:hypothetical protein